MFTRLRVARAVIMILLVAAACGTPPGEARTEWVLGTLCRIDLFEYGTKENYAMLFNRLFELDRLLSASREDSELALVNRNAGVKPAPVSPELMTALSRALYFAGASPGPEGKAAFDPTVGPLVKLWGIGSSDERVPAPEEIASALSLVNWRDVILPDHSDGENASAERVLLRRTGMALDLGGIAKGYAADELARLLYQKNIPRALIDLGGNIYVYGTRTEAGASWRVGVQNPLDSRGSYLGVLSVRNTSVVTSGVYERFFEAAGKRYHHILDTASGYPVENDLLAVTIIAHSSIDADALSTAAFALGFEKGRELVLRNNAEALFVFKDKTIRLTAGARAWFELSDESFRIVE
ncbi:MAG: FAD:protein FMN transferase [Treponema sp.]|nr:FAD:protein FMN transferase [Treponema sp.]